MRLTCRAAVLLLMLAPLQAAEPADLDALLEPIRQRHGLPALGGAVVTSGGLVGLGAVGFRKQGAEVKVTHDDRFHLGSCTKAMTATLIGLLVEEGKLQWRTTLAEVFPELMPEADAAWRTVTVEQLLAHRGGFTGSWPEGLEPWNLPGGARGQRLACLKAYLAAPPAYPPGTKQEYTNAGYAALGCILEQVTDTPWEELITARLFGPLGMASAGFGAPGTPGTIDQPWAHRDEDGHPVAIEPGPAADNPDAIAPGGKVHASLADWAKFIALHLQGEQGRDGLLKADTIRRLHRPIARGADYFGGWLTTTRDWAGGRTLNHAGSNTLNYCVVWMAPARDFAVLAAANYAGEAGPAGTDEACATMIGWYLERR